MNRVRTGIAGTYLALCLLLGGASAAGAAGNGLLQLLAVLILLLHVWSRGAPALPKEGRWLVGIFLAFAAVAAAQLIPLAPSIWTTLPGRDVVVRSLALLGLEPGAMPASLDPRRTMGSLLWLLPPAAMFLVATRLTRDERSVVAKVLLGVAVLSIALGAFQLLGGSGSRLRFYEVTNPGRSVGLFANANHVATLLLCALPFAALFLARAKKARSGSGGREGRGFIYVAIAGFIGIGIVMNGSLAGYGILIPTAIASFLLYLKSIGARIGARGWALGGVALAVVVGLSVLGPLSNSRLATKFKDDDTVGRQISIPTTIAAARDHSPIGSGLGTFRDVYRTYEPPERATFVFVNHAHNDYAEIALEMGIPGLALVLAFILWWAVRSWNAWRGDYNGVALARAGSIVLGIVLVHSLVDYPLRTSAMAAVAALAAGFMVQPPAARSNRARGASRGSTVRHMDAEAV